jgi:type IV pilus assembly protein PilM
MFFLEKIKMPFFKKKESLVGIDMGTFSTKIVHLSYFRKEKVFLENYGEKFNKLNRENLYKNIRKKTFLLSPQEIAGDIKKILAEAKIKEKKAIFSIPDFMTFFTVFKIPPMSREEMNSAVHFEAKQHIPLSLKEVSLDWSVIEEGSEELKQGSKIVLVAVPHKVVSEYQKIADLAKINLLAIEAEVFSLIRALNDGENNNKIIQLIDVGVQSTTISIVENGKINSVFSIDFSESEIIRNLAQRLGMSYNEIEKIKNKGGFLEDSDEGKTMCSQLDILINEANRVSDNFTRMEKKEINKVVLAGGLVLVPGFDHYFQNKFNKETTIINPFLNVSYQPALEENIKKMGSRYAIAVGLALRNK